MALPIPASYIPAITNIVHLRNELFDELLRRLTAAPILSDPKAMVEYIGEIPDVPHQDLEGIVDIAFALHRVREFSGLRYKSFLNELAKGVQENVKPKISDDSLATVRERFKGLLGIESLTSLGKAISLQRAGERLYCESKILSDIRPVFGQDVEAEPVGAVITHTLKIGYHDDDEHKDFFIVLDQEDLIGLHVTIERAISKSTALEHLLKRAEVPKLGI